MNLFCVSNGEWNSRTPHRPSHSDWPRQWGYSLEHPVMTSEMVQNSIGHIQVKAMSMAG